MIDKRIKMGMAVADNVQAGGERGKIIWTKEKERNIHRE